MSLWVQHLPTADTLGESREHLRLAANNLPWVDVLPAEGANVYSILQRDQLVLSRTALDALVARLHTPVRR